MNGGAIGTMECSTELSHSDSPESCFKHNINDEDGLNLHELNDTDPETDNHVDNASEHIDVPDIIATKVVSNGTPNHNPDKITDETVTPQQEYSSNTTETHNITKNNESCVDSAASQEKSENKEEGACETNLQKECNIESIKDERIDSDNGMPDESETLQASQDKECSETVSINTNLDEDGTSQESKNNNSIEESPKLCPDGKNSNSNACSSPEVQEIASDNENSVTEKLESKPVIETNSTLRRSSRTIKRKKYDDDLENGDDDSDFEEVGTRDVKRKSKAIFTNNTKIDMTLKQRFGNQKKENPTAIRDAYREAINKRSMMRKNPMALNNTSLSAQNFYQSILARGTTVTPVSSKNPPITLVSGKNMPATLMTGKNLPVTPVTSKNLHITSATSKNLPVTPATGKTLPQMQSSSQNVHSTQTAQPIILPSLTDDMFVVEAPSFIVPYVYEKPSIKPFREFVDELGKELAAQKAKEDDLKKENEVKKELTENGTPNIETKETENGTPDIEMKETKDTSEDVEEAKAENVTTEDNEVEHAKNIKDVKKARRRRKRDDEDDISWDGESSTDSEEDISDEERAIVIKDKADPIEEIKDVTDMTVDKIVTGKPENNYFDMTLGKFFMDIGLNVVQEYVQSDLLKQQNRKLYKEKKGGHSTKATEASISALMKNLEISKENNAPYMFKLRKCKYCSFKTESVLIMSHHLETPHMKNNVYTCNFCEFENKGVQDVLIHMEAVHCIRGRLERTLLYHQCPNCPFEDNGKGKLARHLLGCAKKFKPEFNLSPPIEWEPPAKIPKMAKARNQMLGSYQNAYNKSQNMNNSFGRPLLNNFGSTSILRPKGRSPMGIPQRPPVHGIPILRGGIVGRQNNPTPVLMPPNSTGNHEKNPPVSKSSYQPSISITALPRQPQPLQLPPPQLQGQQNKSSCVICEICDGYIKDLEQLRNHMQWIHKVKIHPKMIHNRPPLNCQKCQFRFFTDQGLERHLLGSHGLVTSSMQEAANKGKDAGRCPVCGRVYQWKLLNHVTRDHKLQLKPAHLSYKCTVCTATFGMYKQFENHVYSQHSVVAKRAMDKDKTPAQAKPGQSLLKPLKINDEITITPHFVKAAAEK